jgi:hypothetical protein
MSCTVLSATVHPTAAVATTTGAAPMILNTCTNSVFAGAATVTTGGTFTFTASSTTNVTLHMSDPGSNVLTVSMVGGTCVVTVPNGTTGVTIPNNTWANSTHRLTLNAASLFPINRSAGCGGLFGAGAKLSATLQLNTAVTIT